MQQAFSEREKCLLLQIKNWLDLMVNYLAKGGSCVDAAETLGLIVGGISSHYTLVHTPQRPLECGFDDCECTAGLLYNGPAPPPVTDLTTHAYTFPCIHATTAQCR